MPGTGFVELALTAGETVGAEVVEELTLERPLLLDEEGAVQMQLSVAEPDEAGRRSIAIYSARRTARRTTRSSSSGFATPRACSPRTASSVATAEGGRRPAESRASFASEAWPPEGAQELDTELLYDRLAEAGYHYGPSFQGLSRAFRVGDELYAEVALESEQDDAGERFLHSSGAARRGVARDATRGASTGRAAASSKFPSLSRACACMGGARACCGCASAGTGTALSLLALDEDGAPGALDRRRSRRARSTRASCKRPRRRRATTRCTSCEWVELPARVARWLAASSGGARRGCGLQVAGDRSWSAIRILQALEDALEQGAPRPRSC